MLDKRDYHWIKIIILLNQKKSLKNGLTEIRKQMFLGFFFTPLMKILPKEAKERWHTEKKGSQVIQTVKNSSAVELNIITLGTLLVKSNE